MNKLVRNKIPEFLNSSFSTWSLTKNELKYALREKLLEEAKEVIYANSKKELIEELADCIEVIKTIIQLEDLDYKEIEKFRKEKKKEKGGFDQGVWISDE